MPVVSSSVREPLLSPSSDAVIRATAGVVAAHADQITARFYPGMLTAYPALRRVFNMGNQHREVVDHAVVEFVQSLGQALPERGQRQCVVGALDTLNRNWQVPHQKLSS